MPFRWCCLTVMILLISPKSCWQDGGEHSIWDDHLLIGRDEEDGEGMGEPRWAGVPRLPGAANLHPAQVQSMPVHMHRSACLTP